MKPKQITRDLCRNIYQPPRADDHKGRRGHALVIAGSYGKMGAATLMARAAISSGCGLVTAFIPECGYQIMQISAPEVMVICDTEHSALSGIKPSFSYDSAGIGPGIGQSTVTREALSGFLKQQTRPMLLDADAINMLATDPKILALVPSGSILTPHPGELRRLLQTNENDIGILQEKAISFASKHHLVLVLKGAPTFITDGQLLYENTTGNPALATAGSGDVLSGIITSLCAQSYEPMDAAMLGTYLHGSAADLAVVHRAPETFLASHIITGLSDAFGALRGS